MQILKSLRWRIQAWHALILLVVVASFGGGLFLEARRSRFEQIDADLLSGARVLEGVLRAVPGGFLEGDMTAAVGNEFPPPTAPDRRAGPPPRPAVRRRAAPPPPQGGPVPQGGRAEEAAAARESRRGDARRRAAPPEGRRPPRLAGPPGPRRPQSAVRLRGVVRERRPAPLLRRLAE